MKRTEKWIFNFKSDYILESYWIFKIINKLSNHGLNFNGDKILYSLFKNSKKKKINFFFYLLESLEYIRPSLIFVQISKKKTRPLILSLWEQYLLALKWLFLSISLRKEQFICDRFNLEINYIIKNKKSAALNYKKKIEVELYEHYIAWLE